MNTVKPIIEIKNIGKEYNITHQRGGYVTLRDILAGILKNPFRFAKHKAKQIAGFEAKEAFWALRDVSFDVMPGEIVGIIGANGAGKSTLLKILTGITPPTEGEIIMRGRVASLLEVGTGFHPELTGRENIFLNGAILGMTKKEIARKFDEIVAFSGVEKFLDTPVKYYSSGMYVRLAFSVAAHMEPDILLIDEVLAVGDAEFQKKCLGKMEEVTRKDGRTILFVSHNMGAVQQLCSKTIMFKEGHVVASGPTNEVIDAYLSEIYGGETTTLATRSDRRGSGKLRFTKLQVKGSEKDGRVLTGKPFKLKLHYEIEGTEALKNVAFSVTINDPTTGNHLLAFWTETSGSNFDLHTQEGSVECVVDFCPLLNGYYSINLYSTVNGIESDYVINAGGLTIDDSEYFDGHVRDAPNHPKYVARHAWRPL